MLLIVRFYTQFKNNALFEGVMGWLRPAVVGLIGAAAVILIVRTTWFQGTPSFAVVRDNFPDWKSWCLLAAALMILTSGTYNVIDQSSGAMLLEKAPELGNNYAGFTQSAVDTVFAGFGSQFVSIAMVFFAFSTIMAYYFYAETGIIYLCRGKGIRTERWIIRAFQALMLTAVVFGAVREADLVWQLGEIGVGVMAWGTVISILILCPKALKALKEFETISGKKD